MKRVFAVSGTFVLCVLPFALPAVAQEAPAAPRARATAAVPRPAQAAPLPAPGYDNNAPETQRRLQEVLQGYPPSIGSVLAMDPTLLSNPSYLETYPVLANFLAQHPEIAHNPGYFLNAYRENRRNYDYNDPKVAAIRTVNEAMGGIAFLIGFITVIGTIAWLLRTVIEHRKWLRVSKTHVDTHTKIMDRLSSNEDLMSYMQSPAGRRFLEAAPIPVDGGPRMLNAPFGRILWSVQAGVVIAFLGGALIFASHRFAGNDLFSEAEMPIFVMGAAAVAVGAGFCVSAFAAYGLSRRLGLFAQPPAGDAGTGPERLS